MQAHAGHQDAAVDAAVAAVELQPVVQHGFNVCVHYSVPYVRESVLVFLAVLTIAAFTAVIACAYDGSGGLIGLRVSGRMLRSGSRYVEERLGGGCSRVTQT